MKSRLLLNLVLVCVVAALALVAVFEPGKDKPKSNPLTSIEESGVDHFTLRNQEVIEFQRENGSWWLKSPFVAPANEIRVRQLLDIARLEADAQYPLASEDRAKFELDRPKISLTVGDTTILFGGSDPIDMRRYVQIGTTLYLVRDDFYHHLSAKAIDYVDKKLLPEGAKISSISLPDLTARLGSDGKWTVEPKVDDPAAIATALLNTWQSARAVDLQRWEKPGEGPVIRIGFADSMPAVEFVIVKREPELVLGRRDWGLSYELVGDTAKQLLNQKSAPPDSAKESDDEDKVERVGTEEEGEEADHESEDEGGPEDIDSGEDLDSEEEGEDEPHED